MPPKRLRPAVAAPKKPDLCVACLAEKKDDDHACPPAQVNGRNNSVRAYLSTALQEMLDELEDVGFEEDHVLRALDWLLLERSANLKKQES